MESLKKPEWRDVHSLMSTLKNEIISEKIIANIIEKRENGITKGEVYKTVKEDACEYIPNTIKDIRYFDIREISYWIYMFLPVILFFLFEMFVFLYTPDLILLPGVRNFILFALVCVALTCILLLLTLLCVFSRKQNKIISVNALITLNVVITSLGILVTHFFLVYKTGGIQSPFFSALTFAALTIVGLPRENNKYVLCLTATAIASISIFFIIHLDYNSNIWKPYHCTILLINISVLAISIAISVILRICSSKKIIK
jgi:hypothetical protein